jgi:hypothetical protein
MRADQPEREEPDELGGDTTRSGAGGGDRGAPAAPDRRTPAAPDREEPAAADGGQRREAAAPVSRAEQLAAHITYRETVAAADRAAADRAAWSDAVPGLRADWAEHTERYPERMRAVPRTESDGSWSCGDHRRLDPEQNTEAGKAHADLADEASRYILPALRRVEAADPERKLAGLEHMIKGEDRLKEKLADYLRAPETTVKEALGEVPDAVRFTFCYPADRYSIGVLTDVDQLKSDGYELIKLKNLWDADQYKGINSQWRMPETGSRVEMQFHTPESLEAKELTHEAYERIRSGTATLAEEGELEGFQRQVNGLIATPPGTDRIKDFPEKKDA